jgi:hypothetical protein
MDGIAGVPENRKALGKLFSEMKNARSHSAALEDGARGNAVCAGVMLAS